MKKDFIISIICSIFVILFLYTGTLKLWEHSRFIGALHKSPLLINYANIISWLVPCLELLLAMLLLRTKTQTFGLYGSLALMSAFTIYIGYMLASNSKLPCTCGGIIQTLSWRNHLYLNLSLCLLSAFAILSIKKTNLLSNRIKNDSKSPEFNYDT